MCTQLKHNALFIYVKKDQNQLDFYLIKYVLFINVPAYETYQQKEQN